MTVAATRPEGALGPYLRAIRAHGLLVIAITALTVAASCVWLLSRSDTYEATAQLLVTPLPQDDTTFIGIQILRESGEPTRTTQTAATLVSSRQAAELTAPRVASGWSVERVEDAVEVEPQGESSVLAVTARAGSPGFAARLANEFAAAALEARQLALRTQIGAAISQLEARRRELEPGSEVGSELAQRLSELELVRGGVDPTLSLLQEASVPTSPIGPPSWLVILLSFVAGLTLAALAALLVEALVGSRPPPGPYGVE